VIAISRAGASGVDKIKIYSPRQVLAGSFVGGPIAAVFMLWKNFQALQNRPGATQAIIWGVIFLVAVLLILPYLPDKFPNYVIPAAYSGAAFAIANQYQMPKQAILDSQHYTFQSNWNVFGIAVGFIVLFIVVIVAWLFALDHFGFITL